MKLETTDSLFSKSASSLNLSLRYVIIVYKGPANTSNTQTESKHALLRRLKSDYRNHHTAIQLRSVDIRKSIFFDIDPDFNYVDQRYRFNNKSFSIYLSNDFSLDLWDNTVPYVLMTEYQSATPFYNSTSQGTIIGGAGFSGEVTEIIYLGSDLLRIELLDQITEQLNDIYGLY